VHFVAVFVEYFALMNALTTRIANVVAVHDALAIDARGTVTVAHVAPVVRRKTVDLSETVHACVVAVAYVAHVVSCAATGDTKTIETPLTITVANVANIVSCRPGRHTSAIDALETNTTAHVACIVFCQSKRNTKTVQARICAKAHTALVFFEEGARYARSAVAVTNTTGISNSCSMCDTVTIHAIIAAVLNSAAIAGKLKGLRRAKK
jgi:hypothetical protein